jgi:GT2 family glycosyltransferase
MARGRYVLLLNPDTVVREDTFRKCLAFMDAHPEAGALGVRMIDGSGKFLPESKRGFPSPFVAFCKTFGLSSLFPRSKVFNRYHLGYLDEHETHAVDVLAGAFLLLRREALDKAGLLDESFFMYGEDIDLSYRIVQAGYRNYYFAGTTIIHYKGESTRKGSLNYVRTFYQAMIIFARKHFRGREAWLFITMIHGAIYLRAGITLLTGFLRKSALPLLDAALMLGGLFFLQQFWAEYYYRDPDYYDLRVTRFNLPFYTMLWVGSVFFSGGYDEPGNLRRLVRGLLIGTLLLAAIYGFLPLGLRPSRAVLLLGAAWAVGSTVLSRTLLHFLRTGNLSVGKERPDNLVIAGSAPESERVRNLLGQAGVRKNYIGTVSPVSAGELGMPADAFARTFLATMEQLEEVVHIFKIDEIIFCSKDISSEQIMSWMSRLGSGINYKIVPLESLSIIGSNSKDAAGELYTIEVRFQIADKTALRNKRMLDLGLTLGILCLSPILMPLVHNSAGLLRNIAAVAAGKKSWVGYSMPATGVLPAIRPGVLCPPDALGNRKPDPPTLQRLDFRYAKDYEAWQDLEICFLGWRSLGRTANLFPPTGGSSHPGK